MNEKVEKFRLTKEQAAFMKQFSKMAKARKLISSGILKAKNELQSLSQLAGTLNQGMKRMIVNAPKQKINELEGQEALSEKNKREWKKRNFAPDERGHSLMVGGAEGRLKSLEREQGLGSVPQTALGMSPYYDSAGRDARYRRK